MGTDGATGRRERTIMQMQRTTLAPAHGDVKWRPVHGVPRFGLPREPLEDERDALVAAVRGADVRGRVGTNVFLR